MAKRKMTVSITGFCDVIDAVEAALAASDLDKREALAKTIDSYSEDFPAEFYWAVGPKAPTFLHLLMAAIHEASHPESRPRDPGLAATDGP
jgi:hypothetical protein